MIYNALKKEIIKRVLLSVGLSTVNPLGKIVAVLAGKFIDKFVQPEFNKIVASIKAVHRKKLEEVKLQKLKDAINDKDKDRATDIIDQLR